MADNKAKEAKATKERTKEFTSKDGNVYTFQRVKPSKWMEILDQSDDGVGRRNRVRYATLVLENVVAIPGGLTPDSFEEDGRGGYAELDEVVGAAIRFQQS